LRILRDEFLQFAMTIALGAVETRSLFEVSRKIPWCIREKAHHSTLRASGDRRTLVKVLREQFFFAERGRAIQNSPIPSPVSPCFCSQRRTEWEELPRATPHRDLESPANASEWEV
jgi:hypothetical protein